MRVRVGPRELLSLRLTADFGDNSIPSCSITQEGSGQQVTRVMLNSKLGSRKGVALTIRSSRDRFAASCKSANFHLHKAAKRPVLTQALDRRRQELCQKQLA